MRFSAKILVHGLNKQHCLVKKRTGEEKRIHPQSLSRWCIVILRVIQGSLDETQGIHGPSECGELPESFVVAQSIQNGLIALNLPEFAASQGQGLFFIGSR